jgi:hypothetical protein
MRGNELFRPPFVVFLGDIQSAMFAKTAFGLAQWRGEDCLGQVRLAGCTVDVGIAELDLPAAIAAGAHYQEGIVDGVFSTDGYIDGRTHTPTELAGFIQERVSLSP